jgi:hypothetical protein
VVLSIIVGAACSTPSAPSAVPAVTHDGPNTQLLPAPPVSMNEAIGSTESTAGPEPFVSAPFSTAASTLITAQDGWSSATGFRSAESAVQRQIVRNALAADRQSSGQSVPGDWQTDAADGDGERMRSAINLLAHFMIGQRRDVTAIRSRIELQMKALLTNHDAMRRQLLVDRMFDRWTFWSRQSGSHAFGFPLRDDRQLLAFMGINRQCLEWVNAIGFASGGRQLRRLSPGVPLHDSRPGMGLFDGDRAMIIVDVDWRGGTPARFRVAEANWGNEWINPTGQIPWQRTVIASRIVPAAAKVVRFD